MSTAVARKLDHAIVFQERNPHFVLENLPRFAELKAARFAGGVWQQPWSLDPHGTDSDVNACALIRHYAMTDSDFFTAEADGNVVGYGIGQYLTPKLVAREPGLRALDVKPGGYYFALAAVDEQWKGLGICDRLVDLRWKTALGYGCTKGYVRTHLDHRFIIGLYRGLGFETLGTPEFLFRGRMERRIYLSGELKSRD